MRNHYGSQCPDARGKPFAYTLNAVKKTTRNLPKRTREQAAHLKNSEMFMLEAKPQSTNRTVNSVDTQFGNLNHNIRNHCGSQCPDARGKAFCSCLECDDENNQKSESWTGTRPPMQSSCLHHFHKYTSPEHSCTHRTRSRTAHLKF